MRRDILRRCLASLNEREQYIIAHRMLTDEPETLDDIGVRFGISRERVRQIEKKLLNVCLPLSGMKWQK